MVMQATLLAQYLDFVASTGPQMMRASRPKIPALLSHEDGKRTYPLFGEWRCSYCSALCTTHNCRNCGAARGL